VSSQKIFLFDFDGVIVDGMQEYWHSSLLACERYLNSPHITIDQKLYQGVPNSFKEIRPWVKYGWEMILIVHEIIKIENPLKSDNKNDFINNYHQNCQRILNENSWIAEDIQKMLDNSRKYQIDKDFKSWVNLHKPFFEIINFMKELSKRGIKTGVITTKGKIFAEKILKELNAGSCVGIVSISPGLLRAAEVIIHSMRGSELILMTAISDNNSRLLSLLKASNHIVCDGPSLSVVENTLLKNRSQLMRLPQIICAKNYLSIETINQLKKEIGVIN